MSDMNMPPQAPPMPQPTTSMSPQPMRPMSQLSTNRGLLKFVLLGIITFGIYPLVIMTTTADALNTLAGRYDGRKTMNYCLLFFLVAPITLGIANLVWYNNFSDRIGHEQARRGMAPTVTASTYWLWGVLGSLIIVGPFIYTYRMLHAMNALCADYNARG